MLLWGDKTIAWFDVWSIEHFVSGMNLYLMALWLRVRFPRLSPWGYVATLCFAWEALEHYLEIGMAGPAVATWFAGVEFVGNRLVTDPLMLFLGAYCIGQCPRAGHAAKLFSLLWLAVHIFVFPHSMYLQQWLDGLIAGSR